MPASLFQPAIIRALERSLGRKVEVGEVHLSLFGMPGFTVDDVTIHEDPRAGIEPFAYVPSLGADVSLLALLHRKLEFSTIRISGSPELGDPSINLVKTDAGPWNFPVSSGQCRGSVGKHSRHQDARGPGEFQIRRHQVSLLF